MAKCWRRRVGRCRSIKTPPAALTIWLWWTRLAKDGRPRLSLFRAEPRQSPIAIAMMERHPLGSQAFMPADNFPWLVLVASGDDIPDSAAMRCFMADGEQGINYRRGVWHHPLLALPGNADNYRNFWVLDRAPAPQESPAANLQECQLPSPCEIWL